MNLLDAGLLDSLSAVNRNCKLLAAIAAQGVVTEPQLLHSVAEGLGLKIVDLKLLELAPELSSLLPRDFMINHRCLPVRQHDGELILAMADPLDFELVKEVEFKTQQRIQPCLAAEQEILLAIQRLFGAGGFSSVDFDRLEIVSGAEVHIEVLSNRDLEADAAAIDPEMAPIIRLVNKILADAISRQASDIHLVPTEETLEVRFRVDGMMVPQLSIPRRLQPYVTTRIKLLASMDITERRRPQDGGFQVRTQGRSLRDLRASAVPTPFGETLVLRILHSSVDEITFDKLGMDPEVAQAFHEMLSQPDRLVVATGPTGSGKSTTLYGALSHVRNGTNNIITVEDPIEFKIEGITQIQVNPKIGLTFATGLRSVLRQDPDVILVGEIRDLETAEMAFQAAQTGHLVLSTLHTNDAPSAVTRLMDLGLEPFVVSSSLGGVISQRLIRLVCKNCARTLTASEQQAVRHVGYVPSDQMRVGSGCKDCDQTGYRGRRGLYSVLKITPVIREMIHRRASEAEIWTEGRKNGLRDLQEMGREALEGGLTTLSELERVVGIKPQTVASSVEPQPLQTAIPKKIESAPHHMSVADLADQVSTNKTARVQTDSILLVDDDPNIRAIMSAVFDTAGFEVIEAEGGEKALHYLERFLPQAIVLDLMMPQISGQEFMRRLRKEPGLKEVPVLVLTAADNESNEIELFDLGVNDFVSKTSSPAVVVSRLKRLTNHSC